MQQINLLSNNFLMNESVYLDMLFIGWGPEEKTRWMINSYNFIYVTNIYELLQSFKYKVVTKGIDIILQV